MGKFSVTTVILTLAGLQSAHAGLQVTSPSAVSSVQSPTTLTVPVVTVPSQIQTQTVCRRGPRRTTTCTQVQVQQPVTVSVPTPAPVSTPVATVTPGLAPVATLPVQSSPAAVVSPGCQPRSLRHIMSYNSDAFDYFPYFADQIISSPIGKTTAIPGSNGVTMYLKCLVDETNTPSFALKGFSKEYVKSDDPNACVRSLHRAMILNGYPYLENRFYFDDAIYSVAVGSVVTVRGHEGHTLALKCDNQGQLIPKALATP